MRDGLLSLLKQQPDIHVIGSACDGLETVTQVTVLKPDVVVMDISMPHMNGIEATQQILTEFPRARVIILSMHSTSEHVFRALQAGARGYLLKESAGPELVLAIRTVFSGARYLSQKITDTVVTDYLKSDKSASPLEMLSAREREVLQLVAEGKSSLEISKLLFLSTKTIETYRSRLMTKLGIKDIPSLVKFAVQHGLTSLD